MKNINRKVLSKLGIVVIVVIFLFAGYTLIPSKKVVEENIILEKVATARDNSTKNDDVLIMAEKGGYLVYPENTKMAFDKVIKTKDTYVDIIELDIRTTLDGYLVIIEDETINRLALEEDAEPVYVSKSRYDELDNYNLGRNFKNLDGEYPYMSTDRYSSQGLTLLKFEDFLKEYKSYATTRLYMFDFQETGEAGKTAVKKAVELLQKEDYKVYEDSVILSSSDTVMINWMSNEYSSKYAISGSGQITESLLNSCKFGFKVFNNPVYSVVQYDLKAQGLLGIKYNTAKKGFIHKIEEKNVALIFKNVNTEEDVEKVCKADGSIISTGNHQLVNTTLGTLLK